MTSADFNFNGSKDFAVTGVSDSRLGVRLGNGSGSFPTVAYYTAYNVAGMVAQADISPDGNTDLVVADQGGTTVKVFLSNGAGASTFRGEYAAGQDTGDLAVGDLNRDGVPDVIASNTSSGTVTVLLGNRNGSLSLLGTYAAGKSVASPTVTDWNGDGYLDVLVSNREAIGAIAVLPGVGDGSLLGPVLLSAPSRPFHLATGDLNRDGRPDSTTRSGVDGRLRDHQRLAMRGKKRGRGTLRQHPVSPTAGPLSPSVSPHQHSAADLTLLQRRSPPSPPKPRASDA